ncbi:MAG TPA: aquaporin, partial [Gaiellaceae bacterium]|nr:aquaporin [Gaiellaceae bacterium]
MVTDVLRRAAAEFVGTFALILIGAGAVIVAAPTAGAGNLEIALANGLVIGVMTSAVGHISGGHFNPAVTLGFLVTGRLSPVVAGAYWVAQLVSAIAAAFLLKWIFPDAVQGTLGSPAVGPGIQPEAALILEA